MAAQGAVQVLTIVGQLLCVPAFLSTWGNAVYADWLVLSALAGLVPLADLGITTCLGNAMRAAVAREEAAAGNRLLRIGITLHAVLVVALVSAVAVVAAMVDVPRLAGVEHLEAAGETLFVLLLSGLLLLPRSLVATVQSAHGEFDREIAGIALVVFGQLAGAVVTALCGGTPLFAAISQLALALVLGWGVLLVELRQRFPEIGLTPAWPTLAELRMIVVKAPLYGVHQGSAVLLINLPTVLLGQLGPPGPVVVFATMRTFTGLVRQVAIQMGVPIGMEMARMHVCSDDAAAHRLYHDSSRVIGCIVGLAAVGAWVSGPTVFALWTGGRTPFDAITGFLFLAGAIVRVPGYCAAGMLRLADRPAALAASQLAELAVFVSAALVLVPPAGAAGAALAICLGEILASGPWQLWTVARMLRTGIVATIIGSWATAITGVALGTLAAVLAAMAGPLSGPAGLASFAAAWLLVAVPAVVVLAPPTLRASIRRRFRRASDPTGERSGEADQPPDGAEPRRRRTSAPSSSAMRAP